MENTGEFNQMAVKFGRRLIAVCCGWLALAGFATLLQGWRLISLSRSEARVIRFWIFADLAARRRESSLTN